MSSDIWNLYFANLSEYNAGRLVGGWINVIDYVNDPDSLTAEIAKVTNGAEESAIHDNEGGDLGLGECVNVSAILARAEAIEEHGLEVVRIALDHIGGSPDCYDEIRTAIENGYSGQADSPADYAEEWHTDCGSLQNVPPTLAYYIDWARVANDMGYDGITFHDSESGGVIVWRDC